jgi:A/G-specific adenine glycosylase
MDASAQTISADLLRWYDANARALPWRSPPGAQPPDPYRVWLSEVMLQQTTVAAVGPYFARFIQRWPTVHDLAAAEDADVMAAWAGLGYYARARNLLACARAVASRDGAFPETETALRELPGLGAYTAAAVAAIAFGQRAVVVDANVERVVARLFAITTPLPAARAEIRTRMAVLTPAKRPGDFAQAMMDLGATVCTTRNPRCLLCPLSPDCRGRREGAERFPVKPAKAVKPQRKGRAFWIERSCTVWLVTRPGKGMLGGMRALPDDGWVARGDGTDEPPLQGHWKLLGSVRHSFTHFDLELQLMLYSGSDWATLAAQAGEWWPVAELEKAGLPTLFAKAARLALAQDREN